MQSFAIACTDRIQKKLHGSGVADVGRRKRKRRKAAIAAAGMAGCFLLFYFVLVNFLVSAALKPSFMERLKAFETITEESCAAQVHTSEIEKNRRDAWKGTRAWLETAERRKVSIQSRDGYTLAAEIFPAEAYSAEPREEENHKWVVLLHGYTGWKEELYPFARWYHGEGYHVLAPDLRCHGESEGDFIGMGWTDHFDCMGWIQYILSRDAHAEIVLHGQSMGAATALMAAGEEELPYNVKVIISDCSYTDAYTMFRGKIGEWFGLPAFPFVDSACLALKLRGGYDLKKASALEAVKKSEIPILYIHGEEDAMIPVQMTNELYEATSGPKELLLVEGAGHAQSQDKDPDTYYGTIRMFCMQNLMENADICVQENDK